MVIQWLSKGEPLQNKFNLPKGVLWTTLALSIIPSILVVGGISIAGESWTLLPPKDRVATDLVDADTGMLMMGQVFYNIWVIFGIAAALIVGILAFVDYHVKKDISTPIVGSALLCTGLYDAYSLLISGQQSGLDTLYSSWFVSRMLHAGLLVLGTWYFLYVKRKQLRNVKQKNALLRRVILFFASLLILAVYVTGSERQFSPLVRTDTFITHPFEFIPLVIYLLWGFFILPKFINRYPSIFSRMLVLSVIPAAFAQSFMAAHYHTFDSLFNIAHFLRAINYIVPLFGISMNYIETIKNEKKIIERLDSEMKERLDAQQVLEKREALLASAERIAGLGSWEFDVDTGEVKWSDEMYGIFGYKVNEVKASMALQESLMAPEFRDIVKKKILSAIRNKDSYSIEYQIIRPGGNKRYVLGQGSFITNGNKLVGTLLDITDLKEATQKLAQNESLLREAEAVSHNGSWEWYLDTNNFHWSDELYRIHGFLPGAVNVDLGFYRTVIHPEDVQTFNETLSAALDTKSPFSCEFRILRTNGEVRYLYMRGKFKTDFGGIVTKALGNTQDITELKNASILLDKSESIYRTIAKNVPDAAVFMYDKNLDLILYDGPIIKQLRNNQRFKPGTNLKEILDAEEYEKAYPVYMKSFEGTEQALEREMDGKTYKVSFTPVRNSTGEVFSVMAVMHDITDIKLAQKNLEVKVDELNRSNNDLEQFAYVASHDLQEPLRKIRAFGDRLQNKYSSNIPEEGLDYVNRMKSASERMQTLIDDLLTFSRVTRSSDNYVAVELQDVIKNVITDLEYSVEKKNAVINVSVNHSVEAIPGQMRQLFQNFISNALKFNKPDIAPAITIASSVVKGHEIESGDTLKPDKEYCRITIQDNGIGFDEQYAEKIFVLFQRLHARSDYQGTGIGLAVCKKIIDNHNGFVIAQSKEGDGATFTIILPLTQ
ncbi:MAG TPA: PAS domain S-box protein [Sphingobacteriaceae bacterium]